MWGERKKGNNEMVGKGEGKMNIEKAGAREN